MKRCAMLGMLMLALVSPVAAQQPTQASEVVMQSLYKRLASTRSAVLLDAASDNAAVLGHVYMYDRPRCILSAPEVLKRGLPVSMQTYDTPIDVSDITLVSREAKQTGSYTVSSSLAAELAADLKQSGMVDASVSLKALTEGLSRSSMSFRVVREEVVYAKMRNRLGPYPVMLSNIPDEYEGLLIPIAKFYITDFKYNTNATRTLGGGASLAADTLNKLFGDLESSFKAERRKLTEGGVEIETSATFAFKPNVLIARNKKCPRW